MLLQGANGMGDSSRMDLLKTVGAYALMEKISDGYLGPVYKSYDKEMDRAVEIRVFCDGIQWDDDLKRQTRRVCAPLIHLEHPQIASLIALHTEGRIPFMVMDPAGKRSLRSFLDRKKGISFESKISIMMQVARALAYAHEKGIVHQDICPENIFIRVDGSVRVRDFAVAHCLRRHLPHPAVRYGAPIYLSPEQIQHQGGDERSDIFAVGVVFYELLTGSHPFFDPDSNKMLDNILHNRPHFTFEQYPHFHPRIWQILKGCLAKKQEDRYQAAGEMQAALQSMVREMSEDIRFMLSEVQASFAALKAASEYPDASKTSHRLSRNVWNILRGTENPDYERLDAMMTDLCEIFPEIQSRAVDEGVYDGELQPRIRPEDLRTISDRSTAVKEKEQETAFRQSHLPENREGDGADMSIHATSPAAVCNQESSLQHDTSTGGQKEDLLTSVERDGSSVEAAPIMELRISGAPETEDAQERSRAESFSTGSLEENVQEESEGRSPDASPDNASNRPAASEETTVVKKISGNRKLFRIPRRSVRLFAPLVLILLIVAAVHALQEDGQGGTAPGFWINRARDSWMTVKAAMFKASPDEDTETDASAAMSFSLDDSEAAYETLLLDSLEAGYADEAHPYSTLEKVARIRDLIRKGAWDKAQAELDRMRRTYPDSHEIAELYEECRREAALSGGGDGDGDEGSPPLSVRKEEARRRTSSRQSGTNNPGTGNETATPAESTGARLTVLRLSKAGNVLLDGSPVGQNGEVREERIAAGRHTVAIQKDGFTVSSRNHSFNEGRTVTLVYDLDRRDIHPMEAADREMLERRQAAEKVHSFKATHSHGFLRGDCRGEFRVSYANVEYQPQSGGHEFSVPFKILKLEREGEIIRLFLLSDDELFQTLKMENPEDASRLSQTWTALKSLSRQMSLVAAGE